MNATGFDAALATLAAHALPLGQESVPLSKAGRRILAAPVLARVDAPRQDSAAMDGFALRAADLAGGCTRFRILGESFPATPFDGSVGAGEAVRVATGAPMPTGTDYVRIVEEAIVDGALVSFATPSERSAVRRLGSDFASGATVLEVGRVLEPRALVAAAAADAGSVTVWRRPRVAVLAIGDALVAPGSAADSASPHALPDSLSEAILLLAHQWGAKPIGQSRVGDEGAAIRATAAELLAGCDVLVLVGGASRGRREDAMAALAPLGLAMQFADLAIKPGRPTCYGRIGAAHVIALPGNPTAAMTIARVLLVPLLTGLAGRGIDAGLRWVELPLAGGAPQGGGRDRFLCAESADAGVRILDRESLNGQALLTRADLLVRLPATGPALPDGAVVPTLRF